MRRVYQLWGPVYSPASLLPETGPVPGGTTAVPRLLSAYSGLSLAFLQALESHLESRQHMYPDSSAHRAAGPEVFVDPCAL